MNKDKTIQMARDNSTHPMPWNGAYIFSTQKELLAFAAAIRAATKEEDAKICDEMANACRETKHESFAAVPEECAKVIRASK